MLDVVMYGLVMLDVTILDKDIKELKKTHNPGNYHSHRTQINDLTPSHS